MALPEDPCQKASGTQEKGSLYEVEEGEETEAMEEEEAEVTLEGTIQKKTRNDQTTN